MTVLTKDEYENLLKLASAIPEENLKANATNLIEKMSEVISGIGDRDITWQPTFIRIIQGTTDTSNISAAEGATVNVGSIVVGNEAVKQGMKVIPIALWQSRTLWDKDEDANGRKICNSPDAKVGWRYGNCNACKFGIGGESTPPPCNKEYAFLLMDADFSNMYMIKYHKSMYRTGMDWAKEITQARVHPFKRVFELNSRSQEKKKTVKEIHAKLHGITANLLSPEAMLFLEAIYKKQVSDRATFLLANAESVKERMIARANGDTGRSISHVQDDSDPLDGVSEQVESGAADGSDGYSF